MLGKLHMFHFIGGQKLSSEITYKKEEKNHLKGCVCLYTVPVTKCVTILNRKTPFCNIFFYMSCMLELQHTTHHHHRYHTRRLPIYTITLLDVHIRFHEEPF